VPREFKHNFVKESLNMKEAEFGEDFSNAKIKIIEEGFNRSKSRYYTKESIQKDMKVFEGLKMYANHEDDKVTQKRGARDIRDWVATIKTSESGLDSDGKVSGFGQVVVHAPWFKDLLKSAKESDVLGQLGASINAYCSGVRKKIDGVYTNAVEGFAKGLSVDFVSEAGAGGKVLNFQEAYHNERSDDMDLTNVTLEEIKESAPELYKEMTKSITDTVKESLAKEAKEVADKKTADLKAKESKDESKDTDGSEKRFDAREAKLDRKELVSSIISESTLPANAKDRIKESILDSKVSMKEGRLDVETTKTEIAKVIESEEKYIKEFTEAKISGNGSESKEKTETDEKFEKALEASFDNMAGIEATKEGSE